LPARKRLLAKNEVQLVDFLKEISRIKLTIQETSYSTWGGGIQVDLNYQADLKGTEMGTFEWDILNPDRIINLEIKNEWRTSNI